MKKIHQFVYRQSGDIPYKKNEDIPYEENGNNSTKNIIEGYTPVVQLGIQGLPGNTFSINGSGSITLSNLGIFEISDVEIMSLTFSNVVINNTDDPTFQSTPLIIDIVYDKEG